MHKKSTSCTRCFRRDPHYPPKQQSYQPVKKPESYLTKKFDELYEEHKKLNEKKTKKIKQICQEREVSQLSKCTFQPTINANGDYFVSNDPFLKRQKEWKSSIEKKITAKRQQEEQRNNKNYTFKPNINSLPSFTLDHSKTTRKPMATSYAQSQKFGQKKSYKNIYQNTKKLKQLTKSVIIEPFPTRKNHQKIESSNSIKFSKTMTTIQNNFSIESSPNLVEKNQTMPVQINPEDLFRKDLKITEIQEYEMVQNSEQDAKNQENTHDKSQQRDNGEGFSEQTLQKLTRKASSEEKYENQEEEDIQKQETMNDQEKGEEEVEERSGGEEQEEIF